MINKCYVFYTKTEVTFCHDYQGQEIAHIKQLEVAKLTTAFSMLKVQDYYSFTESKLTVIYLSSSC